MSRLKILVNRKMLKTRGNLDLLDLKALVFGSGYGQMNLELRTVCDNV